jgi:hypothetical protein
VSYRPLSPAEITEVLVIFLSRMREEVERRLEGIDGRNVTDTEQLLYPSDDIMPIVEGNVGTMEE